jgi:hypothetical protein
LVYWLYSLLNFRPLDSWTFNKGLRNELFWILMPSLFNIFRSINLEIHKKLVDTWPIKWTGTNYSNSGLKLMRSFKISLHILLMSFNYKFFQIAGPYRSYSVPWSPGRSHHKSWTKEWGCRTSVSVQRMPQLQLPGGDILAETMRPTLCNHRPTICQ